MKTPRDLHWGVSVAIDQSGSGETYLAQYCPKCGSLKLGNGKWKLPYVLERGGSPCAPEAHSEGLKLDLAELQRMIAL